MKNGNFPQIFLHLPENFSKINKRSALQTLIRALQYTNLPKIGSLALPQWCRIFQLAIKIKFSSSNLDTFCSLGLLSGMYLTSRKERNSKIYYQLIMVSHQSLNFWWIYFIKMANCKKLWCTSVHMKIPVWGQSWDTRRLRIINLICRNFPWGSE